MEGLTAQPVGWEGLLRILLPAALAVAAAALTDALLMRRDPPPGFRAPWRRAAAAALLAGIFYVGVFAPLGTLGLENTLDLTAVAPWQLFSLHALLVAVLVAWGTLAYAGHRPDGAGEDGVAVPFGRRLAVAFRLATPRPLLEIGIGLGGGLAIWGGALLVLMVLGGLILALGGEAILPSGPPGVITFLVAQPLWLRVAMSLSAGIVEETFFRGFLQPRIGLGLSTLFFVLAHWSYGQPFMLVGVTLLSVTYGLLARRRGDVWAAAVAHAVFDAVQLLVVVPWVVDRFA